MTTIFPDYETLSRAVAARIAAVVRAKPDAVLGLATGSTPLGVYRELVRLHREENLSFARVCAFNLDEYLPIEADAPQSYRRFMRENLFDFINIAPENCWIPDGAARSTEQVEADCARYEAEIAARGGLDLQLLGIGRTGHIGFNEPGSALESRTRAVVLDHLTRADAAAEFFGIDNVPVRAITMGIATILDARQILLLASGAAKAPIVAEALEGKITSKVPASWTRQHPDLQVFLDQQAAELLAPNARPWLSPGANWDAPALRRRTLISVAMEADKSLEALTPADLENAGASALARDGAALARAKTEVFAALKSASDDDLLPRDQRILCLSPHPDDDVICCGATLLKLAARGNQIWVAYGVSGANAVRDKDVLALLRAGHSRLISYLEEHLAPGKSLENAVEEVRASVWERAPGAPDAPLLRELKRLVREGEAADACRKMGAKPLFWNLPFYGAGRQADESDVAIALQTLRHARPDWVLSTGEFNDPHGTHEKCARVFARAARLYDGRGRRGVRDLELSRRLGRMAVVGGRFFLGFRQSRDGAQNQPDFRPHLATRPGFSRRQRSARILRARPRPQSRHRARFAKTGRFAAFTLVRPALRRSFPAPKLITRPNTNRHKFMSLNFIPQPQQLQANPGTFPISPLTRLQTDCEAARDALRWFGDTFYRLSGVRLATSEGANSGGIRSIKWVERAGRGARKLRPRCHARWHRGRRVRRQWIFVWRGFAAAMRAVRGRHGAGVVGIARAPNHRRTAFWLARFDAR